MDTNYTSQLFLSILFFAPGALLLAGLAFVGILMAIEKAFQPLNATMADLARNPAPGRIVATLKQGQNQQPVAKRHNANQ